MPGLLFLICQTILVCMNEFSFLSIEAASSGQDYTATSLLAEKEAELNTFVRAVEANSRNCGMIYPGCESLIPSSFLIFLQVELNWRIHWTLPTLRSFLTDSIYKTKSLGWSMYLCTKLFVIWLYTMSPCQVLSMTCSTEMVTLCRSLRVFEVGRYHWTVYLNYNCFANMPLTYLRNVVYLNMLISSLQLFDEHYVRLVGADALKTCAGSSCSRLGCYKYGTLGDPNYKCLGVASNAVCGTDCMERNFDYSQSFLR